MARATCGIYEALWLARLHHGSARALYLHLPFCARKCHYCDFASWAAKPDDPLMRDYVVALMELTHIARDAGVLEGCETAYIGGGTPTYVGDGLPELVGHVRSLCPGLAELTCEANPDSLSDELLAKLGGAGCTRLSVGVQSLDEGELQALGRIHSAEQAVDRLQAAVEAGFDVSCDLMCATPDQTDQSWKTTLERAVDCGVGHVSVYPLQIEEGTPFDLRYGDEDQPWNGPEVQAARMELAAQMLAREGFERYEVASYALPGKSCAHNQAYWTAVPYLGIGTRASSMLTREAYERLSSCAPQLPSLPADITRVRLTCTDGREKLSGARSFGDLCFDMELLSDPQATAEDLMLGMRMTRGIGPGLVAYARKSLGSAAVDAAFDWCERRGLAVWDGQSFVPTQEGWLLGNELYGRLWDLAPGEVQTVSV